MPGRAEVNRDVSFERGIHDRGCLNRIRLDVGIEPRSWLRFHASGDSIPGDRRHHTFDHLYQAGFSKYGTADPLL